MLFTRVHKKWFFAVLLGLALGSCKDSQFKGGGKTQNPPVTDPNQTGGQTGPAVSPGSTVPGSSNPSSFDGKDSNVNNNEELTPGGPGSGLNVDNGGGCVRGNRPLVVVFAIDSSTSMLPNITAMKDNIVAFANQMRGMTLQGSNQPISGVKFGAVSYVDAPNDSMIIPITADIGAFQAQIAAISERNGMQDICEGGLLGAEQGLAMLRAEVQANPGGAIPVLVMITDNYSHNGLGPQGMRSFDPSRVAGLLAAPEFNAIQIFDATPLSPADVPNLATAGILGGLTGGANPLACPGAPVQYGPNLQWEQLRQQWRVAHNNNMFNPGASIGFPFTGALLSSIPSLIQGSVRICQ